MFLFFSNICSALFNAQFLLLHLLLQKFFFMLASLKGSILTNKGPIFIETSGWNILKKMIFKPRPFKFLPAFRRSVVCQCDGKKFQTFTLLSTNHKTTDQSKTNLVCSFIGWKKCRRSKIQPHWCTTVEEFRWCWLLLQSEFCSVKSWIFSLIVIWKFLL